MNGTAGENITVYGGVDLKIISRVSDKSAGEAGSPVQFDPQMNPLRLTQQIQFIAL